MRRIKGTFKAQIIRNGKVIDEFEFSNMVVREGRNFLLKVGISNEASQTNWYVGLIGADVTIADTDTASSALGTGGSYQEVTAYDETARPQYQSTFSDNKVTNQDNQATFNINDSVTVYGAFVTSTSGKNDNTGVLLCAGKFDSAKNLSSGDVLNIVYSIYS